MFQFILLSVLVAVCSASRLPIEGKIFNGTVAKPGEIPYIVSVRHYNYTACVGSIIDSRHVVTSLECAFPMCNMDIEGFAIQYGMLTVNSTENLIEVVDSVCYQNAERMEPRLKNGIALLTLKNEIPFSSTVQEAVLPVANSPVPEGSAAIVSGWELSFDDLGRTGNLQSVNIKVYTNEDCEKKYEGADRKYHICAGSEDDSKGVCIGDDGTPLNVNGVLVGINSWPYSCGTKGQPAVYTNVATYVDWINESL